MPIKFMGIQQNILRDWQKKAFVLFRNFSVYFAPTVSLLPMTFMTPNKATLSGKEDCNSQTVFFARHEEQCPSLGTLAWKLLEFKVVQYWEAFTMVIQLLGKFNLKQLEWWVWLSIVSPWGGERTEGAFRGSWVKLLGGQWSRACSLSNSACQLQQQVVSCWEQIQLVQCMFVKKDIFRHSDIMGHSHIWNPAKFAPGVHREDASNTDLPGNGNGSRLCWLKLNSGK